MQHPGATEFVRGQDSLYATCDTALEEPPFGNSTVAWQKTKNPVTSPQIGTPAFQAWARGEEIWEPVIVLHSIRKSPRA